MTTSHQPAAANPTQTSARSSAVLDRIWRLRVAVFVSFASAFSIELSSRLIRGSWEHTTLLTRSMSMVALVILCGVALCLVFLLRGKYTLKTMASIATGLLLLGQVLSILRGIPSWYQYHRAISAWSASAESWILLCGIVLLLATFYFALLEAVWVKSLLRRETTTLAHEIAVREQIETELRQSRDELRQLSAHIDEVREEERASVARDIHDELGQELTSLKIELAKLDRLMRSPHPDPQLCATIVQTMSRQLDGTVNTIRRIIAELHPSVLEDLGLQAAIEWVVDDFQNRTHIPCTAELNVNGFPISRDVSSALFRIVQESLTNVARHSKATNVSVRLTGDSGKVHLEIADNGRGTSISAASVGKKTFGVLGMRERVLQLGGEFHFDSAVGAGTRVSVTLPNSASRYQIV